MTEASSNLSQKRASISKLLIDSTNPAAVLNYLLHHLIGGVCNHDLFQKEVSESSLDFSPYSQSDAGLSNTFFHSIWLLLSYPNIMYGIEKVVKCFFRFFRTFFPLLYIGMLQMPL